MSATKTPPSVSTTGDSCSSAGSLDRGSTTLQELRNQIAAQSGRLVLVFEKQHRNGGYSVYYKPEASFASICRRYYREVLQRLQLHQKAHSRTGCERKLVEAAARRASLRQAERERLMKQRSLVERVNGKKQELFASKCAQALQALESRELEALNRRLQQQEELKQKFLVKFKKSERCREEVERRVAELRNRIEAREKQAHALRCEHLQKIRKKCAATAERTSVASTVTSREEEASTEALAHVSPSQNNSVH